MERKCAECNNIIKGRADKKFCSDQCRYLYNNRLKLDKEKEVLRINSILRKNRTILKRLNPVGKTTVRKEVLKAEKFDFNYFTHIYITNKGNTYYFCYEYGYLPLQDEKILIVNWQNYMKTDSAV
jgi:hypothetical protein